MVRQRPRRCSVPALTPPEQPKLPDRFLVIYRPASIGYAARRWLGIMLFLPMGYVCVKNVLTIVTRIARFQMVANGRLFFRQTLRPPGVPHECRPRRAVIHTFVHCSVGYLEPIAKPADRNR